MVSFTLLSAYAMVAFGSHNKFIVPLGNVTVTNENDVMTVCRSLVYDNRIKVARVATGFLFPMRFENLEDQELKHIVMTTRNMI